MKKRIFLLSALLCICCWSAAVAAPWAVVATQPDVDDVYKTTIHTVDMGAVPPKMYGPFLNGQIGSGGGGVFDVAMLPGQRFAIVSNFGDSKIFLIDLKNPKNPVVKASVQLGFFAEDIAVSPDGRLALVSDGGFSPKLAFIDLRTFTVKNEFYTGVKSAQAVAIAPNGTVLFVDYFNAAIHYGTINAGKTGLDNMKTIYLCDGAMGDEDNMSTCSSYPDNISRPVNVEISPDGKTALVAVANAGFVNVLEIKGPGEVVRGNPFFLKWPDSTWDEPRGGVQCVQFQSDARAYVIRQPIDPDGKKYFTNQLREIRILGPGWAAIGSAPPISVDSKGTSQLFGVDSFGIAGGQALVGNPTLSGSDRYVSYVNLVTGAMTPLKINNGGIATGVGIKLW